MMRRIVSRCRRDFSTAAAAAAADSPEKIVVLVLFERPSRFVGNSRTEGDTRMSLLTSLIPAIVEECNNDKGFSWLTPPSGIERLIVPVVVCKVSLNRALERRLHLLVYGNAYVVPSDKPVWHFPEKFYDSEKTLESVESALHSVLGDLSNTYFVGNAPMGHMTVEKREDVPDSPSFKQFFFKSQVIAKEEFNVGKCKDFVWVTKEELLEYFPDQAEFLNKMIIS